MAERRYSEIMNVNAGGIEMSTEVEDEEEAVLFKEPLRRNLIHLFDNAVPSEVADEHMAVYLHVQPFSAQELEANENQVIMPPKVEKPIEVQKSQRQRSTTCWDVSSTPRLAQLEQSQEDYTCGETESEEVNYVEILEMEVIKLRKELQEMKLDRLNHEVRIRKVCKEMQEQFVKIEDMYSTLLRDTRQEQKERYEKRLKLLQDSMNMVPCKRPQPTENASGPSNIRVDNDDEWVSSMLLHQEKVKVEERDASLLLAREELIKLKGKVTALEFQVVNQKRKNKSNDMGQSVLIETLGHQLQEARDRIFQQEKQISDLNEMLTDAGETSHQKESELQKLKTFISENEIKMIQQEKQISDLNEMLTDAGETSHQKESELQKLKAFISENEIKMIQQEKQISDLNEMLTDAGETSHQKESELQKLKTFISENEIKMIQQVETNQELHKMLESNWHALKEAEYRLELKNKTLENMKDVALTSTKSGLSPEGSLKRVPQDSTHITKTTGNRLATKQ